jgi:protein-S-isoprenylcysteine O-methyltransferase Ste14
MPELSIAETHVSARHKESSSVKRIIPGAAFFLWSIGSLFVAAGHLDWIRGWLSVALSGIGMTAVRVIVQHYNAPLLEARAKWHHKDAKFFDKVLLAVCLPLISIQPAIGGLDAGRYHWTAMPFAFVYVGTILFALALFLITWAAVVNPFAETSVRIQTDRGHTVVTSGPYRFVRHPMYVGAILVYLSTPLIWGSGWALGLGTLIMSLFIWRTGREDRTLRRELAGYEQYTATTRYRLVPGLW